MSETERAAQHAHENARQGDEDYDDEGRPAASRARENARGTESGGSGESGADGDR